MPLTDGDTCTVEGRIVLMTDCEGIGRDVDRGHIHLLADIDKFGLTDSIQIRTIMLTDRNTRGILDWSRLCAELVLEKHVHRYIANKAQSLAIGTVSIGQTYLRCKRSDRRLGKSSEWKQSFAKLILGKSGKEIGLVFCVVYTSVEMVVRIMRDLSIVARSHVVTPQ